MKKAISLNGLWQASGISPDGKTITIPAKVPGMIHVDLAREGYLPDMYWRDNANQCQWVEDWTWTYRHTFTLEDSLYLDYAVLEFGGLDTYADIKINGTFFAHTQNAQIAHHFDASKVLKHGENTIEVTFTPYQENIKGKPLDYVAAFNRSDRVHVRRMQCTFYWDWVNRFITFGLWRPVTLYLYDNCCLQDVFVYTQDIARTSASLQIRLETEIRPDLAASFSVTGVDMPPETAHFLESGNDQVTSAKRPTFIPVAECTICDPSGKPVWYKRLHIFNPQVRLQADLRDPQLWWPCGYGEQPLYKLYVKLFDANNQLQDEKEITFGIRTVRIEQLQDLPGSLEEATTNQLRSQMAVDRDTAPGESFILLINGERIFCKGANWVPASPFPSEVPPETYDKLISLCARGNMNLLRCWGGGIYESDAFFEACDRYGVMISQDFMLACARFPEDDEEFMEQMRMEIPKAIRMLRNHTSLVWWAGDNENACHYDWDDPGAPGVRLCREVYYPALDALDPSRPFRPSSPYGGMNNCSATIGDAHMTAYNHPGDWNENVKRCGRFMSESVSHGSTLMWSLRKFISEEDIADPRKEMFEFHVKDNPHKAPGSPTLFESMMQQSDRFFGAPENTEDKIQKYAYTQYEWIRLSLEAARRSKWYCAGIQYWMYNDCWPTVGLALVDHYLIPKGGYYAAKRASQPVIASLIKNGENLEAWVLNDCLQNAEGQMTLFIQYPDGRHIDIAAAAFESPANDNLLAITIPISSLPAPLEKEMMIICQIEGSFGTDRAWFYPGTPGDIRYAPATLDVTITGIENPDGTKDMSKGTIRIHSEKYAHVVTFDGGIEMSDNFFDLLPGEERILTYECKEDFSVFDTVIRCWNM